jgi:hypothetical protein
VSLRATEGSDAISPFEKEGDCFVASLLAMTPSALFGVPVYRAKQRPREVSMPTVSRKELLDALEQDWGTYAERYRTLSEDEKKRFVKKQGYARFADILAHFIAWWEEGIKALKHMPGDPTYRSPDYSVDEFNAKAIARFSGTDEDTILRSFEKVRLEMVRLVTDLPEAAFREKRICDRLHIEILGHMEEHKF